VKKKVFILGVDSDKLSRSQLLALCISSMRAEEALKEHVWILRRQVFRINHSRETRERFLSLDLKACEQELKDVKGNLHVWRTVAVFLFAACLTLVFAGLA
jgi:hypothetical protein